MGCGCEQKDQPSLPVETPVGPSCCGGAPEPTVPAAGDSCGTPAGRPDWLLRFGLLGCALACFFRFAVPAQMLAPKLHHFAYGSVELLGKMWWGLAAGIFFVGLLASVPRELVLGVLGPGGKWSGLGRAVGAGVLLDLCSHGILLVGMQLYRRGASLGQTAAFLIASPWNSISLTFILIALIGLPWTLCFILLSAVVAMIAGAFLDRCVARGTLPANPNAHTLPEDFRFWKSLAASWRAARFDWKFWTNSLGTGLRESKMILRWIFIGVLMAAALRAFLDTTHFQQYFGPTLMGLMITIVATTIIEVCSEGSSPIAADLLQRAHAPGNAFAFLMAGVATDYTEIMGLKETTRSWKIALFLPLVTVPQVIVIGWILNQFHGH
ncbi:MAG: permease [Verrucomicrobiales bacterium]